MRGGGSGSPSMVTVPASTSLNNMGEDELIDDVFEDNILQSNDRTRTGYKKNQMIANDFVEHTPSPTGYRDYKPPAEVLERNYKSAFRNKCNDKYSLSSRKLAEKDEGIAHKTILLGDSGVGKTSLLVQFDTGRFQHGNFAATVGIGFTVMLLGDSGVGKTCLLTRFRDGRFLSGNYISTVGIDFRNKLVTVDDAKVKLQIWDTAGQERFRSVTHAYYRDAHALLLLYDVTNKKSYDNIRAWLGEIREYAHDDVVIMLLGNKCDCGPDRNVQREDGEQLAEEYKVPFMETSAKTGMNVELAFLAIARELLARSKPDEDPDATKFNVQDYVLRQQQSSQRTNSPSSSSSCFTSNCLT